MSNSLRTALKQMRQSANNLSMCASDVAEYKESEREIMRKAAHVLQSLSNALESGPSYILTPIAQEFDKAMERK